MATTFLTKTLSASPTDNNKWTFSCWFKRTGFETQTLIYSNDGSTSNVTEVAISDAAKMVFQNKVGGSTTMNLTTNRLFRDASAFYHVVAVFDSSNATEADRQIIYINGVRETSFATNNPASLNEVSTINSGNVAKIGKGNTSEYFNGLMSHVNFADGQALAPTVFGETDSTSGIWTIKTAPSLTYGTNGFFILKDGNTITDSSPNSNNFALAGGTLTKTEDCPDNNFATLNPLYVINASQMPTLTNGNTTGTSTSSGYSSGVASIAPAGSGKYYSEHKLISGTGGWNTNTLVGYSPTPNIIPNAPHDSNFFYGVLADGGAKQGATSRSGYAGTWTTGDIIRLALDLDNNRLYVGKNAYWSDGSGNWDEANINAYINLAASPAVAGENWFMMCGDKNTSTATWGNNFGNGYFGTTAVASAGTNASGNGIFEYDVPTGYTAISTKGLNL